MQTNLLKKKICAAFTVSLFLLMTVGVALVPAQAETTTEMTIEDWGIHVVPSFPNVTYTIDGTGSDWWDSEAAGIGASRIGKQLSNPIRFSIGFDGYYFKDLRGNPSHVTIPEFQARMSSAGAGAGFQVTNTTSSDALTGMDEATYQTGSYDFKDLEDEDTNVWDKNCTTAANAFNVTSKYYKLNKTLSTAEDDEDFDNKDFDKQYLKSESAYSFVNGYSDTREGMMMDLKNVLALLHGVDIEDIKIQSVNLSTCYITYNTTEDFVKIVKTWVDEAFDTAEGAGMGASISSFSVTNFLNSISSKVRSASISFGTGLKQFGQRTIDWIKGSIEGLQGTASKAASDLYRTAKGTVKSAISGGQKLAVNIGNSVGTGINKVVTKGMNILGSAATKVFSILANPILWILIVIVLIVVAVKVGPSLVNSRKL